MNTPLYEIKNISKYFAKVVANKNISFSINKGEVLALLGENGAGKSTVMKILYGLYRADEGEILKNGKVQKITSPKTAMSLKIAMIQQHFSLVAAHTVLENIILGNVKGIVNYKECSESISKLARKYHFDIDINAYIKDLPVGTQQKVEILKALYLNAELLIMDEPTAVLTPQEIDNLMNFIKEYTKAGNSVVLITHKMKEVLHVADRIIVMRNGEITGNISASEVQETELSTMMMGKELKTAFREIPEHLKNETCLKLENVTMTGTSNIILLNNISLDIKKGEIFGISGVSGNGQDELCESIIGASVLSSGNIFLSGKNITQHSIKSRIAEGIGYVPLNRHKDAIIPDMSLAENMILKTSYDKYWSKHSLLNTGKINSFTKKAINNFNIKASGTEDKIKELSGGNQQKVVLAREVYNSKELLIMNQPTRGLDIGAIQNIHNFILRESENGKSILLVSTELSELFALCDRIAVMYKGGIMKIFKNGELSVSEIGLLMAGLDIESEA